MLPLIANNTRAKSNTKRLKTVCILFEAMYLMKYLDLKEKKKSLLRTMWIN